MVSKKATDGQLREDGGRLGQISNSVVPPAFVPAPCSIDGSSGGSGIAFLEPGAGATPSLHFAGGQFKCFCKKANVPFPWIS
jgi:hypothetical protein